MNKTESKSLNLTIKLIRVIGSPFNPDRILPDNAEEALELFYYAKKNKIALLYLESLRERGKLEDLGLDSNYKSEKMKHDEQLFTACRISEVLNSNYIDYAIFKSLMPFPATPNDVDIIHFGSDKEFEFASRAILNSNYIEVEGYADAEQRMFHDRRVCDHLVKAKKDIYDVDLYHKISASYVQYLNKAMLKKHVIIKEINGVPIKVIRPEAELIAIIIHSIIPEMLCTLLVYYATLYYIKDIGTRKNDNFIDIARENKVCFSIRAHFSLVAEIHKTVHGVIPIELREIIDRIGPDDYEKMKLIKNEYAMPYKYSLYTISKVFLEKSGEAGFRKSVLKQMIHMLNPRLCKWVIYNILWRRQRETY